MRAPRITTRPGFHELVDVLGTGSTEEWRELYQRAKADAALRGQIRRALPLVDPEVGSGAELWIFLLEHIERVESPHD
ncbi:MAG: hypothetical protein HY703_12415 [Gemmatimonadetes bacterium]|nr:hypothetical protein [Gemmatimonadota bacterium]